MQQGLSLPRPAVQRPRGTVVTYLRNVPADGPPALDLPFIVRTAAAKIIAAVPLEPSTRVFFVEPSLLSPNRERLGCIDAKEIQLRVMTLGAQLCPIEPACRKFIATIGHISAAENSQLKHLFRREFRSEVRVKIPSRGRGQRISIVLLHFIVDLYPAFLHVYSQSNRVELTQRVSP